MGESSIYTRVKLSKQRNIQNDLLQFQYLINNETVVFEVMKIQWTLEWYFKNNNEGNEFVKQLLDLESSDQERYRMLDSDYNDNKIS